MKFGNSVAHIFTRSQAVARIADRTASQQTLVISDCC